jgi:hypothetical protein
MKHAAIAFLFVTPMSLHTGANAANMEDRTLAYSCRDAVVVGRVESADYEAIGDADDLPGRGIIRATVKARKTLRGAALPKALPVTYIAHVYMRSDRDFMLVLNKKDDGSFSVSTAQLMSVRPRLAARCG